MGILTPEMQDAVATCKLSFCATTNADGTPNLSPKSSLAVYDDDHLVFANIASPNTIANLRRDPTIEVNVVDIFFRKGFRFRGTAEIHPSGPVFDFVAVPFWNRQGRHYPIHEVVKVKVERALPVLSPAYVFNDNVDAEAVRRAWLTEYGVAPLGDKR